MKQVPITNNGITNLHVAGVVIRPGCTRMVDAHLAPPDLLPVSESQGETPPAEEPDALAALLEGNVAEVVKALPALSDDDLTAAENIETGEGGKARKGVTDAIAHERLRRAAEHVGDDAGSETSAA